MLMYNPEIVRQLVKFTLDNFIFNRQVQEMFGLSELKYEIVRTLHEHIEFSKNPEIDTKYKGLWDFQLKLTSTLLIQFK